MGDLTAAAGRTSARAHQTRISVALVTGLVVLHLLMAAAVSWLPDHVFDLFNRLTGQELAVFITLVLPTVPLAVVVLLWARSRPLGWVACAVVLAGGAASYLRDLLLRHTEADVGWSAWVVTIAVPLAAALGWGIARRTGSSWWPGVLLAGALAAFFRSFPIDIDGTSAELRSVFLAFVYHVVPAVVGGLTCWWLDGRDEASG